MAVRRQRSTDTAADTPLTRNVRCSACVETFSPRIAPVALRRVIEFASHASLPHRLLLLGRVEAAMAVVCDGLAPMTSRIGHRTLQTLHALGAPLHALGAPLQALPRTLHVPDADTAFGRFICIECRPASFTAA